VLDADALRIVGQAVLTAIDSKLLYEFYVGRMRAKLESEGAERIAFAAAAADCITC